MTVQQIIADIDAHNLSASFAKLGGNDPSGKWAGRIGDLRNMRLAPTFEAAVLAAWAAYTGEDRA